jgi:squamous cell carcinoma antigen recognized by T-cells 3
LEPGRALSVAISDPERKKERTDVGADQREVYVAGLSRFVTKEDLEALFGKV